jgi:hypothetical protein
VSQDLNQIFKLNLYQVQFLQFIQVQVLKEKSVKKLTRTEEQVMKILWDLGEGMVQDVGNNFLIRNQLEIPYLRLSEFLK